MTEVEIECTCGWSEIVSPTDIESTKQDHYQWAAERSDDHNHDISVVGEV